MAFGPERRLRKHSEFVRSQGDRSTQRVGTTHFTLLLAPQRTPGPSRLGLVVGRRIGGAVQRNRVKRLCRECFRSWPRLVPDGIDLIVIARAGAPELDLARVRAEWAGVSRLLEKRAAEALARAARNRPASPDKPDNPNKPDNPDNPNKPDKPDNPDNPDKPSVAREPLFSAPAGGFGGSSAPPIVSVPRKRNAE